MAKQSSELEKEIRALDMQAANKSKDLDSLMIGARAELIAPATNWINGALKTRINAQPETVQSLGPARLRELKERVAEFVEALPTLIAHETDEKRWPHRQEHVTGGVGFFDSAYRNIISDFGSVLEPFGLMEMQPGNYGSWEKASYAKWRYSMNTGFDPKELPRVTSYNIALRELDALNGNRAMKRKEFAQAKARELFDSA